MTHPVVLRISESTWTEVRDRLKTAKVALLPSGANEAQGPHMPMSADFIMADQMCMDGAKELGRRGIDAIVLPGLPFGGSYASYPFPGSIVLQPSTIAAVATDIGRNMARHGIKYLLIASAHLEPTHLAALDAAVFTLTRETSLKAANLDLREPRWASRLSEEFQKGWRHGGQYGTSLVLAARPDLVRMDIARRLEPIYVNLLEAVRAGARTFDEAGSPLAYFGDPAKATAEEGERWSQALAGIIADVVVELMRR